MKLPKTIYCPGCKHIVAVVVKFGEGKPYEKIVVVYEDKENK